MTAKEYLKQAYLLDKQIQVEVKELEQLREMRGTIQGLSLIHIYFCLIAISTSTSRLL